MDKLTVTCCAMCFDVIWFGFWQIVTFFSPPWKGKDDDFMALPDPNGRNMLFIVGSVLIVICHVIGLISLLCEHLIVTVK